jgi:hypothetical protein
VGAVVAQRATDPMASLPIGLRVLQGSWGFLDGYGTPTTQTFFTIATVSPIGRYGTWWSGMLS